MVQIVKCIIDISFNQGVFPIILKIANVILIHKKGKKPDCNNYRAIFLLYNISKIYKNSMHNGLSKILWRNNLLFCCQFGFKNRYSTLNLQVISRCYTKDIKMTSVEAILVTLMPTLFLSVAITLEAAIQNNLSKSRKFSEKYMWWSSIIVKPLSSQ